MVLDIRLVECFVTIAREGSFTRAADRLGLAQSMASERLRRLEDMIGLTLLERTSRRVNLSPAGTRFLQAAERLLAAEAETRRVAREISTELSNTLTLGAFEFQANLPIRQRLIATFLERYPDVLLQIHSATIPELTQRFRQGEIDVVMSQSMILRGEPDVRIARIGALYAHLMIPAEDPIADQPEIALSDLRGRSFLLSPGRHDPFMIGLLRQTFVNAGAHLLSAPEADRSTIEHFARLHRAICIRWLEERSAPQSWMDMRVVPLEAGIIDGSFDVMISDRTTRPVIRDFFDLTVELGPDSPKGNPGFR